MVFGNGVKNIQGAAYNGARTVTKLILTSKNYNVCWSDGIFQLLYSF